MSLRLLCIFAHPDDESMGAGGLLARYAAEGVETGVIIATLGQRGWDADPATYPGAEALGEIRAGELREACEVLGVSYLETFDYMDGELDQVPPRAIVPRLAAAIQRFRPQVVVTFPPDGLYGHPDHVATSQFATAALVSAAGPALAPDGSPHQVSKLYYLAETAATRDLFDQLTGGYVFHVDGDERRPVAWPDWAITTRIDARSYCHIAWEAIQRHRSQLVGSIAGIHSLPGEVHEQLWGQNALVRVFSLVNGGRQPESDLFAGLRFQGR